MSWNKIKFEIMFALIVLLLAIIGSVFICLCVAQFDEAKFLCIIAGIVFSIAVVLDVTIKYPVQDDDDDEETG